MQNAERARRQQLLEDCIYEFSEKLFESDIDARRASLKLLDIYSNNFRHSYSGFFIVILNISNEDNEYNLDFLTENMGLIRKYIENDFESGTKEFQPLYDVIDKLNDHLNLEIGRYNYYSMTDNKVRDAEIKMTETTESLKQAYQDLQKASKNAATMQTELIAVLSIFSAIVITFSGGLTFLGSTITAITDAKQYEAVVLIAIICGDIIFNTIFLMMYLVSKITERNIFVKCKNEDCGGCDNGKCGFLKKIQKKLPYIYYFNMLCFLGIGIDLLVWYLDIVQIL